MPIDLPWNVQIGERCIFSWRHTLVCTIKGWKINQCTSAPFSTGCLRSLNLEADISAANNHNDVQSCLFLRRTFYYIATNCFWRILEHGTRSGAVNRLGKKRSLKSYLWGIITSRSEAPVNLCCISDLSKKGQHPIKLRQKKNSIKKKKH